MPLYPVRNNITTMKCDAIVNPTNPYYYASGGLDAMLHRAAGEKMDAACGKLDMCLPGEARVTPGFDLPCRMVLHTVGPVWNGGNSGERETLMRCYRSCLELARDYKCESIAFPLIAAGTFGYPKAEAMQIAESVISEFLRENEMKVYIVIYGREEYAISRALFAEVKSYIDDMLTPITVHSAILADLAEDNAPDCYSPSPAGTVKRYSSYGSGASFSLERRLAELDVGFSGALLQLIAERGMTEPECYNRANIDRKLFNKIRTRPDYHPKKPTVLAFAVALELNLEETRALLEKAGYALSHSSKFDIIVEYFIQNGIYDIYTINDTLYEFDQPLLGNLEK